jgi:hypothetical protein
MAAKNPCFSCSDFLCSNFEVTNAAPNVLVVKNRIDNETSVETNDFISLFIDICYIYIGDEMFTPVGEVFRTIH